MALDLTSKTNTEKAVMKMSAIASGFTETKLTDAKGRNIVIEHKGIGVLRNGKIVNSESTGAIWYRISVDGKYLNGDGWYGFVNPPIKVSDGTKTTIINEVTKEEMLIDNFKEDITAAAKSMILQVVGG